MLLVGAGIHTCICHGCIWHRSTEHGTVPFETGRRVCDVGCWGSIGCQTPHDDVIKWKHFPRYWPFVTAICAGSSGKKAFWFHGFTYDNIIQHKKSIKFWYMYKNMYKTVPYKTHSKLTTIAKKYHMFTVWHKNEIWMNAYNISVTKYNRINSFLVWLLASIRICSTRVQGVNAVCVGDFVDEFVQFWPQISLVKFALIITTLTYWGLHKTKFNWNMLLSVSLTISQHWFRCRLCSE